MYYIHHTLYTLQYRWMGIHLSYIHYLHYYMTVLLLYYLPVCIHYSIDCYVYTYLITSYITAVYNMIYETVLEGHSIL